MDSGTGMTSQTGASLNGFQGSLTTTETMSTVGTCGGNNQTTPMENGMTPHVAASSTMFVLISYISKYKQNL